MVLNWDVPGTRNSGLSISLRNILACYDKGQEGLAMASAGETIPWQYTALYDEQCEICQAGMTWLKLLDRRGLVLCQPIDPAVLPTLDPPLALEDCARELHLLDREGHVWRGGAAVRKLARLFGPTRLLGIVFEILPLRFFWDACYRAVAANRYQLSKCRGGVCRTTLAPGMETRGGLFPFWTCYAAGLVLRLPLIVHSAVSGFLRHLRIYLRTWRRRYSFLDSRLQVFFLGGFPSDLGPIIFGERFWMILYDGLLVDPGSPRLLRSVARHLKRLPPGSVRAVVATHSHEEHSGNLGFAGRALGVPIQASDDCTRIIRQGLRLPFMRAFIIGQPAPFTGPVEALGDTIASAHSTVQVIPAAGHCDDHVVLYDPTERVLLSGDAFMATYFTSPNPDVDSLRWLQTLRRLAALDVAVLVTGHGQIYTQRPDFPDIPGVVIRQDPNECIREKLFFVEWLRGQVVDGIREGLHVRAIEATLFPWNRRWSWENLFLDEAARVLSGGEFSRTELVRTFVRRPGAIDPEVYELRRHCPP